MRKPLELTVHRKFEDRLGAEWYVWQGTCIMPWIATEYVTRKRLTDAELAAEFYRACYLYESDLADNDGYDGAPEVREHRRQSLALHRFATLPSYDEVA